MKPIHTPFFYFSPESEEQDPEFWSKSKSWAGKDMVHDVSDLFHNACLIFRGLFPTENPFFFWGRATKYPWYDEYHSVRGEDCQPEKSILAEVSIVASELGLPQDGGYGHSYLIWHDDREVVQGLAVEVMLHADYSVAALAEEEPVKAMRHSNLAYQNLIECIMVSSRLIPMNLPTDGGATASSTEAASVFH